MISEEKWLTGGKGVAVKIVDLMTDKVVATQKHQTVGHVKGILAQNKINTLPVVDSDGGAVGIVSSSDLVSDHPDGAPISSVMTEKVYTIPKYSEPEIAARMMRNHKIHHLIVTDEKKVVGIVSTFDLLKLVEGKRYIDKNAPTASSKVGKRKQQET